MSATRRLTKEYGEIQANPIPDLDIQLQNDNLYSWYMMLTGPVRMLFDLAVGNWTKFPVKKSDTPYQDAKFKIQMDFTTDFPFKPPVILFKTKIYHPNVSEEGAICLAMLKAQV